ncbi:MAG: class I SAM-dependent methyltransferase [Cyclobacteriaceae bacterium]|nr:class I SAM-dependent methyltransferase [Cyclobacteriaceae bacterium]
MIEIAENTSKNTHHVVETLLVDEKGKKSVLDIPSGEGAFTQRLLLRGYDVYSADIENILKIENKNFSQADMNKPLPYPDGHFDAVVCIDGIEHLENPFLFVRESARVLSSKGILIISTPNISAMRSRWRWLFTGHHNKCKVPLNEGRPSPLHHINMFSYPRLRYVLQTSGFEITSIRTNRIKPISWVYILLYPFAYLFTSLVYSKEEKDPKQRVINKTILKDLLGKNIYFGETLIIKARKKQ